MTIIHRWKLTIRKFHDMDRHTVIQMPEYRCQPNGLERALKAIEKGCGKRITYTDTKPAPYAIEHAIRDYFEPGYKFVAKLEEVWETNEDKFIPT